VQYAAGLGPAGNASSLRFAVESVQIDDDILGTRSARHLWSEHSASQMWPCNRGAPVQANAGPALLSVWSWLCEAQILQTSRETGVALTMHKL
jgi:hypothetical protein